jgi:hypothetical protein
VQAGHQKELKKKKKKTKSFFERNKTNDRSQTRKVGCVLRLFPRFSNDSNHLKGPRIFWVSHYTCCLGMHESSQSCLCCVAGNGSVACSSRAKKKKKQKTKNKVVHDH